MFKPHYGSCSCCGEPGWIVVKKGWRKQCNEKSKTIRKATRQGRFRLSPMDSRQGTLGDFEKKLDAVFSLFIRWSRSADGVRVACVTCKTSIPIRLAQNGHFHERGHRATKWDERNCNPQCEHCNVTLEGNYEKYSWYMFERYGPAVLLELEVMKRQTFKLNREWLKQKTVEYTEKVAQLMRGTTSNRC